MPEYLMASPSKPDESGYRYSLSIGATAFESSRDKTVLKHEGIVISEKSYTGMDQKVVVATFPRQRNNNCYSYVQAKHALDVYDFFQLKLQKFNHIMHHMSAARYETVPAIQFRRVFLANVVDVPSGCGRKEGECFVFSVKLKGCQTFLDSRPHLLPRGRPQSLWILHAFVHHFFCSTEGTQIVDDLRGVHDEDDGYTLKRPTIHSLAHNLGYGDCGEDGIRRVIQKHECNIYCTHLRDMEELLMISKRRENKRLRSFSVRYFA